MRLGRYQLNPARAQLLSPEQALRQYRWSSWQEYLGAHGKRSRWLRVDRVLGEMGIKEPDAGDGGLDWSAVTDGKCGQREYPTCAGQGIAKLLCVLSQFAPTSLPAFPDAKRFPQMMKP